MNRPKPLPTREVDGGEALTFIVVCIVVVLCVSWACALEIACARSESSTESTTDADDTSDEGMTPAQQLLFMRLIKALP